MPLKSSRQQQSPAGRGFQAGDIYSFRTSPITELSLKETGRYAVLKVLGFKDKGVYHVVLDGVFDRHPTLAQASTLPWLNTARGPACRCTHMDWEIDLEDFRYSGSVALSQADVRLISTCRSHGPWSGASTLAEGQWRWRNDRAAYEEERERERQAREARFVAERERYERRLKTLTWERLLEEQPFSRWNEHPPFPPPDFTAAARDQIRSVIVKLQALGLKPKKAQVRAVLKACIEWFNTQDAKFSGVIETEEREDICAALEELAFVAGQRSLVDEIDGWRKW